MKYKPPTKPNSIELEHWEERAAIIEYDGKVSREVAEEIAWDNLFGKRYHRQNYLEFKDKK